MEPVGLLTGSVLHTAADMSVCHRHRCAITLLMLMATASAAVTAATSGSGPPPATVAPAARILAILEAADDARSARSRESTAWMAERQRLEALADGLDAENARLHAANAAVTTALAGMQQAQAAAAARQRRLQSLEDLARAEAVILGTALSRLDQELLPGVISLPPPVDPASDGEACITGALTGLTASISRAGAIAVVIAPGLLDPGSAPRAVRVLRIGSHLGWWVGLDGEAAGTVDGLGRPLHLRLAASAQDASAIRRAIAIAQGRTAPGVVILPLLPPLPPAPSRAGP